jgi:hypothetical protein
MMVLLAVKVAPSTLDSLSGYRTAYDFLAGLQPDDISAKARAIIAAAGILRFLVLGYLALKQLPPRPYLARLDLELHSDERGEVVGGLLRSARGATPARAGYPHPRST